MSKINTFMDFCSGIGGGRLGLEKAGLNCIAYSEIDKQAIKTYNFLYDNNENNFGNLMNINSAELPYFDLMIAGFPCQTFSVIGQRKGMNDSRGQIIYGLIRILKEKSIPYFILENVKGLVNHNSGQTIKQIINDLNDAGYSVRFKVLNSLHYGVPQMRERVYFVGVLKNLINTEKKFEWPLHIKQPKLNEYLIDNCEASLDLASFETFNRYLKNKYNNRKFILDELLKEDYLVLDTRQSDLRLYRDKVPTLRTGRHGILYVRSGKFRKLSGYEALLLQGFPKSYADRVKNKISDKYLLCQAGNAMTVSTIEAIGRKLVEYVG